MQYDFTKKQDIDSWYIGSVELAVKTPLRRQLSKRPDTPRTLLTLYYGLTLSGINSIKKELYNLANIPFESTHLTLESILEEIKGIEE
jgi:hypothetical protein